jgi:hypothetical protein
MKDYTLTGARKNATRKLPEEHWLEDYDTCALPHCTRPRAEEVTIQLCERHIAKAWAAFYLLRGIEAPEPVPEERDLYSKDAQGTIYVVRSGDLIKIGWTSNLVERLVTVNADAVLFYAAGTRAQEAEIQLRCNAHLAKGNEWFHDTPSMRALVDEIREKSIAGFLSPAKTKKD